MSNEHLANIRKLGCVICGAAPCEAHHITAIALGHGTGQKAADRWAIPLCQRHHGEFDIYNPDSAHGSGDDERWLADRGVDGRALASALWADRDSFDAMQRTVFRFRQGVRPLAQHG